MSEKQYKYYAFISYKWEDGKWARRLQRKLESFRLPSALCKKYAFDTKPFKPVFFAETDIQPGPLSEELTNRLNQSKYLIVICSPRSARSQWVGKEITQFIQAGRQEQILLFIIDGEPYSNRPETECIHPVIKASLPEILGVNVHEKGDAPGFIKRERAYIQIITKMLGIDFDVLWKRHRRRLIRQAVLLVVITLLVIGALFFTWHVNRPFDMQVHLQENTFHNPDLYTGEGKLSFVIGTDTFTKQVDSLSQPLSFNHLPGQYKQTAVPFHFQMFGFETVDTILPLAPQQTLILRRTEGTYGNIQGDVRNGKTDRLVSEATVRIGNDSTQTDANGHFFLHIPLAQQKKVYRAVVTYKEKCSPAQQAYPSKNEPDVKNTLYIE